MRITIHRTYGSWWTAWCRAIERGEDMERWDAYNHLAKDWHVRVQASDCGERVVSRANATRMEEWFKR